MIAARPFTMSMAAAVIAVLGAGCRTRMANSGVPTLTTSELARDLARGPASFRGRTVRVCRGRLDRVTPIERQQWSFAAIGERWPHGAILNVKGCGDAVPALDSEGCLQGRIARLDGSLGAPAPDEPVIVSDVIMSHVWYLHAACPARQ